MLCVNFLSYCGHADCDCAVEEKWHLCLCVAGQMCLAEEEEVLEGVALL